MDQELFREQSRRMRERVIDQARKNGPTSTTQEFSSVCKSPDPSDEKSPIVEWLQKVPFKVFMTLTLDDDSISDISLEKKLLRWARKIQKIEKIQLAYIGVVTRHANLSRRHLHLFLFGKNRHGKTLQDCDLQTFKNYWHSHAHVSFIRTQRDRDNLSAYLAYKNMGIEHEFLTYNTKLLKQK